MGTQMNGTEPRICIRPGLFARSDRQTDAEAILQYAERIEEMGFDGVFVGDRMLAEAPASDGKIVYSATMIEATTIMAAIAARTSRIQVGLLIYVVPYRRPLQIAKTFASLDVISSGRIIMGAGVGWNPKEFDALGLNMSERGGQFEEAIPLIRKLWCGERVTFEGKWSKLKDIQIAPASPRPSGIPIWMASFAPSHDLNFSSGFPKLIRGALERVGRLGDGWAPLTYSASAKRRISPEHLAQAWGHIETAACQAGRDPEKIELVHSDWIYVLDGPGAEKRAFEAVSAFFTGDWDEARNTYIIGTPDEVVEKLLTQTRRINRKVDSYLLTPIGTSADQLSLIQERIAPELRAANTVSVPPHS